MTGVCDLYSATLLEVLAEVSALLEDCSQIAAHLETTIGDWLSGPADPAAFPIAELQSIDLLRQIQHDLSALLASDELAREILQNANRVDVTSVIDTPKLERIRNRLMQLAQGRLELAQALGGHHAPAESGTLDLF
jgi:hypothetical protein